jgi:hypothetical protein
LLGALRSKLRGRSTHASLVRSPAQRDHTVIQLELCRAYCRPPLAHFAAVFRVFGRCTLCDIRQCLLRSPPPAALPQAPHQSTRIAV